MAGSEAGNFKRAILNAICASLLVLTAGACALMPMAAPADDADSEQFAAPQPGEPMPVENLTAECTHDIASTADASGGVSRALENARACADVLITPRR
jgi:hypothetical protein